MCAARADYLAKYDFVSAMVGTRFSPGDLGPCWDARHWLLGLVGW